MEKLVYRFHDLFAQLGLSNRDEDILQFIANHRPLDPEVDLPDAPFWSPAQASFLREALEQDSSWSELVDQLNAALRE
ncbi:MAG: DUF2789 domain-containing protein [Tepidimonas sp.]|uniref:DUF2789 domain-containing protein n=1 Tax=Tepidimonas sp. TaxID=2002775 RepID=UPI00259FBDA3|nr:DUF2789 domain-containing protein [Tepidimonas sp.]MDM7457105.1 DUF2789 domain-containing protein [Tepidimonas sp.]